MLDYDGTLSPFTPRRDEAVPYDGVRVRLELILSQTNSRVVIISGRSIDSLKHLLGLARPVEMWGCHGAERIDEDLCYHRIDVNHKMKQGLERFRSWANAQQYKPMLERKPTSLALHWRGREPEDAARMAALIDEQWKDRAGEYDLSLHRFDGGRELRPQGIGKDRAVASIVNDLRSDAAAAYLGDDVTDEDAFEALGERGLKVLVRMQERDTQADLHLVPPDELLWFLDSWHHAAIKEN